MAFSEDLLEFCVEQLSDIPEVTHKKMFGGVGFFKQGKMFAAIMNGKFCLKVNDTNRADFESRGMEQPFSKGKKKGGRNMPYFEVPAEVLEDKGELTKWAERSVGIALQ